jgi:hypothetical protein
VAGGWDREVQVWDAVTGQELHVIDHEIYFGSSSAGYAFSSTSAYLAFIISCKNFVVIIRVVEMILNGK